MRVLQLLLVLILLSTAATALDCQKFALKTGAAEFMTNETINIWLSDVSIRCRDNNKCFDQYTSAELVLPETCIDDFYVIKTISKRDSVVYDPWHVVCNKSGNFTFKVLLTGGTEDCEEEFKVRITAPKSNAIQTVSNATVDNDVSSVTYEEIEPISQIMPTKEKINKTNDISLLILAIFAVTLMIFILLLFLAVLKKRSRPKSTRKDRIKTLKESY